jgi:hypothetical protein
LGVYCERGFSNTCVVVTDCDSTNWCPCFSGSDTFDVARGGATFQYASLCVELPLRAAERTMPYRDG